MATPSARLARLPLVAAVLVGLAVLVSGCSPAATTERPVSPATRAPAVTAPPANGRFDYQIGGGYRPAAGVRIVTRDRGERSPAGRYGICYVNAFQTQPEDAAFWRRHPTLVLRRHGAPVHDPDWPGESILDIGTAAKRAAIAAIEYRWIDGCRRSGFRAVEPDNLDTYTRFPELTRADAVAFATLLARRAHARGLAIGQKNTAELGTAARKAVGFDFAVAEECQVYAECGEYTRTYGAHVIEIEYTDQPRRFFTAACRQHGARISVTLRDRDVVPKGAEGYHDESC